ncbi:hexameric tyrosine-coordinated heme protein [Methylohalomonas lacus]|uniref:hexameric tyrosine-coordinated heme protein n=1 Tax=Methylohalomonas lacus TaxID=398773 RepID=UPI002166D403|nr:hexameric tyrosine-coordinated heme protein [Methylohalomonas lacus]
MQAQEAGTDDEASWLPSLITATPEEGFELAVKMSRTSVKTIQPDVEVLKKLRPAYAHDPDSLIAATHVVAVNFRTIAEANNYWRD